MPLSDWQPVPLVTTGDMWTAAQHNTYVRQNQQVLHDAIALGHGQGSNADMVDGRHAAVGAWPGLVPLDKGVVALPEGTADWLTIATATGNSVRGVFMLVEDGYGATGLATVEAIGDTGGASRLYVRPGRAGAYVTAARVVDDGAGVLYLQVRADVPSDGNGARSLNVYMSSVNDGALWTFATASPSTANVHAVAMLRNGSWRLARSLAGSGATIGWQPSSQMQALFPPNNPSGWNETVYLDGYTSTCNSADGATAYFQASQVIVVDAVRIAAWLSGGGAVPWHIYAKRRAGDAWTQIGSGGLSPGTHWYTITLSGPTPYRYFKVLVSAAYGTETSHLCEFQVSLAATLVLRGVPTGAAVEALANDGTVLESVRNEAWTADAPVMLSTDVAQIAELRVTRPDGSTAWLRYPTWAIDGGALVNGDVLTLYDES